MNHTIDKVSNSELRTFKECQRKWWLSYFRRLSPKKVRADGPLHLGTKIHHALEALYINGEDPLAFLDDRYAYELGGLELDESEVNAVKKEQKLAKIMIEGFLDWREEVGLDDDMELVDVEATLEAPIDIDGHWVTLRGKLDQRWKKSNGLTVFRDWKTTQSFSTSQQLLFLDEQMRFYQLLELLNRPEGLTDGAQYVMLRKVLRSGTAKPPFYAIEEVRLNRAQAESMLSRTMATIREMIDKVERLNRGELPLTVITPNPSRDCTWKCEFFAVCPMFDDGSRAEDMLAEHFEQYDPNARYQAEEEASNNE